MQLEHLAKRLEDSIEDPMWPNHVEIHKNSLRAWLRVVNEAIKEFDELGNQLADAHDALMFLKPSSFNTLDQWVQAVRLLESQTSLAKSLDQEIFT